MPVARGGIFRMPPKSMLTRNVSAGRARKSVSAAAAGRSSAETWRSRTARTVRKQCRCTCWADVPYVSSDSADSGTDMFTKINKSRIGDKRANRICVPFYKNKMKRISTAFALATGLATGRDATVVDVYNLPTCDRPFIIGAFAA